MLRLENGALEKGKPQRWLLVLDFAGEIPLGTSFRASIPSASAVTAAGTYPFIDATLGGIFPVRSDQYVPQPTVADLIRVLQVLCGLSPEGIETMTDLNGDGRIGLTEAISLLRWVSVPGN